MVIDFKRSNDRTPTADEICYWDAPSSELGLDNPANAGSSAPAEPAAPTTEQPSDRTPTADDRSPAPAHDARADATGDQGDEPADPDEELDDLELLTQREEEPVAGQQGVSWEDRYKRLSKRARSLERSLKKSLPLRSALRESGIQLRDLLARHDTLTRIEQAAQTNPRLRSMLFGDPTEDQFDDLPPARRDDRRPSNRRDDRRPAADEDVTYPFDATEPVGRFVADMDRRQRTGQSEILDRLDRLERGIGGRLQTIEHTNQTNQRTTVMQSWRAATDAAAAKIADKGTQTLFRDAMHAAAIGAINGAHRRTPEQVVAHYLRQLNVGAGQRQRATAAASNRVAENNTQLQRRTTAGAPGSVASRKTPRLADFNRDLQRQYAR